MNAGPGTTPPNSSPNTSSPIILNSSADFFASTQTRKFSDNEVSIQQEKEKLIYRLQFKVDSYAIPVQIVLLISSFLGEVFSLTQLFTCIHFIEDVENKCKILSLDSATAIYTNSADKILHLLSTPLDQSVIFQTDKQIYKFFHPLLRQYCRKILYKLEDKQQVQLLISLYKFFSSVHSPTAHSTTSIEDENRLFDIATELSKADTLNAPTESRLDIIQVFHSVCVSLKNKFQMQQVLEFSNPVLQIVLSDSCAITCNTAVEVCILHLESLLANLKYEEFDITYSQIIGRIDTWEQRTRMVILQSRRLEQTGMFFEAVKTVSLCLREVDFDFPVEVTSELVHSEAQKLNEKLSQFPISSIPQLPPIESEKSQLIYCLIEKALNPSYLHSLSSYCLYCIKATIFIIENGLPSTAAIALSGTGVCIMMFYRNIKQASEFATIATNLAELSKNKKIISQVHLNVISVIDPWRQDIYLSLPNLEKALKCAIEEGDYPIASYCLSQYSFLHWFTLAKNIKEVYKTMTQYMWMPDNSVNYLFVNGFCDPYLCLAGIELPLQKEHVEARASDLTLTVVDFAKIVKDYLFDRVEDTVEHIEKALQNTRFKLRGTCLLFEFEFYCILYLVRLLEQVPQILALVEKEVAVLQDYASLCPVNFEYKYLLAKAELCRVQKKSLQAARYYQSAAESANKYHKVFHEALINELAAKFWISLSSKEIHKNYAYQHLTTALCLYEQVGAVAKISMLLNQYGNLLDEKLHHKFDIMLDENKTKTNVYKIVQKAQRISGETDLQLFFSKMLRLIAKCANCDRVALLTQEQGEFILKADLKNRELSFCHVGRTLLEIRIPVSLFQLVKTKQQSVYSLNMQEDIRFSKDKYVQLLKQGRSSMAIPLIRNQQLKGIVYIEGGAVSSLQNSSDSKEVMEILNILCNQMIISIENFSYAENRMAASKQISEDRIKAKQEDEYKNRLQNFIDQIIHELRNPCVGIKANTEFLLDEVQKPNNLQFDELNEYGSIIIQCVNQQKALIDECLDLTKIVNDENNWFHSICVPFNIEDVIRSVMTVFKPIIKKDGIALSATYSAKNVIIKSDVDKMRQILMNLVSNAIKFVNHGSITIHVKYDKLDEKYLKLTVSVSDNGIGMTEEEKSKIFQRFMQANVNTLNPDFGGFGLGLLICKKILERMNGTIDVQSQKNQGTTFTFSIKCEYESFQSDIVAAEEANLKNSSAIVEEPPKPKKILVVDDSVINQKVVERFLNNLGHQTVVAENGLQALELAKQTCFDLIFMDVVMPIMDGIRATKAIREWEQQQQEENPKPRIGIVGLSGNARKEQIQNAMDAGMDFYITKPFEKKQLNQAIQLFAR